MFSVVVLISGAGSNMAALLEATREESFPADIVAVGADCDAPGLEFAQQSEVPTFVVERQPGESRDDWAATLRDTVAQWQPDLVVLSGFMRILPGSFVSEFAPRLINTHPALLPAHPGAHAVRDALEAGDQVTGATVHIVDTGVDSGPILVQRQVPVRDDDTEATLHERIKIVEREMLIATVRDIAEGAIDLDASAAPRKTTSTQRPTHPHAAEPRSTDA